MIDEDFGCIAVLSAIALVGFVFAFTGNPFLWCGLIFASFVAWLVSQRTRCRRCGASAFAFNLFGGLCADCRSADLACKSEHLGNIETLRAQLHLLTDLRERFEILQAILKEAESLAEREKDGVDLGGAELVRRYTAAAAQAQTAADGSKGADGARIVDLTYSSQECLESREPIPEEWCFCPIGAEEGATGFIVLRDAPKTAILVDGHRVELQGGFRGFCGVPRGEHTLLIQPYSATTPPVGVRIFVHGGGCVVLRFDHDRDSFVEDETWGAVYASKAVRGIMDSYLYPWPGSV